MTDVWRQALRCCDGGRKEGTGRKREARPEQMCSDERARLGECAHACESMLDGGDLNTQDVKRAGEQKRMCGRTRKAERSASAKCL